MERALNDDRDVTGRATRLRELDLASFFRPKTVAVLGASDAENRPHTTMWRKIRTKVEADGATVYPVNPNRESVDGVPCVASVADVPVELDLAVILTGDPMTVLPDVLAAGAKFAVVFAADFAETGAEGEARQAELERMLAASGTRLLGPNTNMNAFEIFRDDLPGKAIALVTQSGHQGRPVFQGQEIGIRLSHWAPVGNEADLEIADFAAWFADQPEVGVVATYAEGFKDGRTLQLALDRCARRGKPVVAVKVGRTDAGSDMARAHTGHLTGSDAVVSAVFRQYGVTRVDGLDELLDVSAALARSPEPTTPGVCVYSISGGTGAHMADLLASAGLDLVTLSQETQERLREHIPGYLRVSNPVDSGGAPSADARGPKILDAILSDPGVGILVCPITGATGMGYRLAKDLVAAAERHHKPIFVVWGSPVGTEAAYTDVLLPSALPVFRTFGNCVRAVRALVDTTRFRATYTSPFADLPRTPLPVAEEVRPLLRQGRALSEPEAKRLLAAYGIRTTADTLVTDAVAATKAVRGLGGEAVLKVSSPDIAHKSDLGLVRVGVRADDAARTFEDLVHRTTDLAPGARVDGVLVCEQVSGGVECVVGVAQDPLFGPVVMAGIGGVFLEVLRDVTHRVPPFRREDAEAMVSELRGAALLGGLRGQPPVDTAAFVDAILAVQRLALDLDSDLAELDVNPLLVRADGAVALDALVIPKEAGS
jgi:acetate---CoA ligase (ADP-forming)